MIYSRVIYSLPVEVELFKGKAGFRLREAGDLRSYRHGGELFRLRRILVGTIAIPFAPCHIMGGQQLLQVGGIDVDHVILPHDTGSRCSVTERNTEPPSLIIDKAVKGDPALRAQVCRMSSKIDPLAMLTAKVGQFYLSIPIFTL